MSKKNNNLKSSNLQQTSQSQPSKSHLLKLALLRSGESKIPDSYMVDGTDLLNLIDGKIPFIEVPTRNTPGVRFVTLRYE